MHDFAILFNTYQQNRKNSMTFVQQCVHMHACACSEILVEFPEIGIDYKKLLIDVSCDKCVLSLCLVTCVYMKNGCYFVKTLLMEPNRCLSVPCVEIR